MKANPIVWFEIYVKDMERAKRFYESVFQTKLTKLETPAPDIEMWQFPSEMNAAGAPGALCKMKGMEFSGVGTLVYFHCDDCAVEADRVAKAGGRVQRPKESIGEYGNIALVYDTEGNMIGLHSER
jgi:uncharacterized protein